MNRGVATPIKLILLTALAFTTPASSASYGITYRSAPDALAPLTVSFNASIPTGSTITWDFGDGNSAQGPAPVHTFYAPGTYQVAVNMQDGNRKASGVITVQVRDGGPERAVITLLHAGNSVAFSAQDSRVYAPFTARWTLDGAPITTPPRSLPDGPHVVRVEVNGKSGVLTREVRFTTGQVGTSVPFELEVLRLTNDARARGWDCALKRFGGPARPPLARNAQLDVAARAQSSGMALHDYFDHTSPLDGSGAGQRARAAGYAWLTVAENIAGGQQTPEDVVRGWLNSPGHCRNIMGNFQEVGVSYVTRSGSRLRTYWTQVFGTK